MKQEIEQASGHQGAQHRANMIQLLDWCRRGQIHPHIHAIFPLEETAKALSLIEARKVTGKVVVNPQL